VHSDFAVPPRVLARVAAALTLVLALADCGRRTGEPIPPQPVVHAIGTWEGTGHHTIGFASQSGAFRIRWQTRLDADAPQGEPELRVTVHSAVSGRPLQEVIHARGAGAGAVNFQDDPRPYTLMVESTGLAWSIAVDEVVLVTPAR
jgi:hypothetical protein